MNETANANATLYAALAKAQGQFLPIEKNREVTIRSDKGSYQFRYADLEEILSKTRSALASNGLALIQRIEHTQSDQLLTCLLLHSDGGSLHSEVALPSMGQIADPKKFGAMLTYLRRYMVTAMLGVAADDDLDEDGQGISTDTKTPQGAAARTAPDISDYEAKHLQPMRDAALQGNKALAEAFAALPKAPEKSAFWQKYQAELKAAAKTAEAA